MGLLLVSTCEVMSDWVRAAGLAPVSGFSEVCRSSLSPSLMVTAPLMSVPEATSVERPLLLLIS